MTGERTANRAHWLRRNRWALIALVPAIVLAVAASSFRLISLYLPWYSERTNNAEGVILVDSDQFVGHYPDGESYQAEVTPISATQIPSFTESHTSFPAEFTAVPGAKLWRVEVEVFADPRMVLRGCTFGVEDDEGRFFSAAFGKLRNGEPLTDREGYCYPNLTPGPSFSFLNEYEPAEPEAERPRRYRVFALFALPEGSDVANLRVMLPNSPHWRVAFPQR